MPRVGRPGRGYTVSMSDQRRHTDNDEPVRDNPGQENEQTADPAEGDTAPTAVEEPTEAVHPGTVLGELDAVDRVPRRVPVPALRPALEQCTPTGVVLADGVRVVVMKDEGGVGDALVKRLQRVIREGAVVAVDTAEHREAPGHDQLFPHVMPVT